MSKAFFSRNAEELAEDAGAREQAGELNGQYTGRKRVNNFADIALDRIEADPQARETFDEKDLEDLAASLKKHGQKQPINVRWVDERQKYVIIAGERRFRAAQIAELAYVQCNIAPEDITAEEILVTQVIENALRKDLLPSEKAKAYRQVMDQQKLTATQLAEEIHVNKSTISRILAILDLPEPLQAQIDAGEISVKAAIAQNKESASATSKPAKKKKPKRTKEVKISTGGYTVTVKARKLLSEELVVEALRQAIEQVQTHPRAKLAA